MVEWYEDERFWTVLYPFLFPAERWASAEAEVDRILAMVNIQSGFALDLCCGPGRHSVALAKRGLKVTGVDRSPFLLERARENGGRAGLEVEWVREDMRRFVRENAFDLVLNFFTSFGYFDDRNEDVRVLENVHRSLKPGGALVMDLVGKEWVAKVFQPTTSEKLPDGSLLIQRHEIIDEWSRIRNEWIVIQDERVTSFSFQHTIYSGQELKDRLARAGFGNIRLYGNLQGKEYGPDAERLVAVARR
ncbi:MAG: class I SAM-dependent methyltransferase [Acidobacteriota bacterium]